MTHERRISPWLGLLAASLGAISASAAPDAPVASASVPTPPGSAPGGVDAGAPLPVPSGAEIPGTPSEPPTKAEWATAKTVRMHRGGLGPCKARLLREWLELRCESLIGAGLVAGDPAGVTISAYGDPINGQTTLVVAQLPVRRGEARIVSFLGVSFESYEGISFEEAGLLSVLWRPGRPEPVLVMSGFGAAAR